MPSGNVNWEAKNPSVPDRYIFKIREHVRKHGLDSLLWVSGIHTKEIASGLYDVLTESLWEKTLDPSSDTFCVLLRPEETRLVQVFKGYSGCIVGTMTDFCTDSFMIVNKSAILNVTSVVPPGGSPKFDTDTTVVSLYESIFNMLKKRSTIIFGSKLRCPGTASYRQIWKTS